MDNLRLDVLLALYELRHGASVPGVCQKGSIAAMSSSHTCSGDATRGMNMINSELPHMLLCCKLYSE
jgi:hypothetical protein